MLPNVRVAVRYDALPEFVHDFASMLDSQTFDETNRKQVACAGTDEHFVCLLEVGWEKRLFMNGNAGRVNFFQQQFASDAGQTS